jgi:hypothetical protein
MVMVGTTLRHARDCFTGAGSSGNVLKVKRLQ